MSNPDSPAYFNVPAPQHFAVRPDLFEELCLRDQFLWSLPRTPDEHARWLRVTGASAGEFPLSTLTAEHFREGQRFILHKVALPGNQSASNLVRLKNGWVSFTQPTGLPEFIFQRAVRYATARGVPLEVAQRQFAPADGAERATRRAAPWAIGIERASGHAVVLQAEAPPAFARYLGGERTFITPPALAR